MYGVMAACPWISGTLSSSTVYFESRVRWKYQFGSFRPLDGSCKRPVAYCKFSLPADEFKFVLHDALESSGHDTSYARAARDGFCSEIKMLTDIERETSISINSEVDLAKTALHIAAEDDSLISHSSVPLPVEDFISRLDDLSMGYCSYYGSSFRYLPVKFLESLEKYLYFHKGFRRSNTRSQVGQSLYLHSVLTHRIGSASMLSLVYSEVLKMLRFWGVLNFDVEVFFPFDSHSPPTGYDKRKSREADVSHIMTSESLLVEILKDLKDAFWPFQFDRTRSLFLRAAQAAQCYDQFSSTETSGLRIASAKAAEHRLRRGVWTSVPFGDMWRALAACERLILLETDPKELRDYSVLLYHCGLYEDALKYLNMYEEIKEKSSFLMDGVEEEAVEKLMTRLKLNLMEEGWSTPSESRNFLSKNSDPW